MKLRQLVLLSAAICSGTGQQLPLTIKLQGFVRDFSCLHPDFESPAEWCREQTGLLMPRLTKGPDARPISMPPQLRGPNSLGIYKSCQDGSPKTGTRFALANFGQFYMDEYYQDIPGVNIAIPIELELSLTDPANGLYSFSALPFFPINGKGYTREVLNENMQFDQADRVNNYWYTTELRVLFFYRGGEVFTFNGDDDLWVFIDGQLTNCDLGGIHSMRSCSVNLDTLGLLQNDTYEMQIFHAERHWKGSSFQITTSIVPINKAPIVTNTTVIVNQDSFSTFRLQGFDPDYNPNLRFKVLSGPSNGQLSVPLNEWFQYRTPVTYTPNAMFAGSDTFQYMMTDGQAESNIGYGKIAVNPSEYPPIAFNQSETTQVGTNLQLTLQVEDRDTTRQDLKFYLLSTPQYGYARIEQDGQLIYEPINNGKEELLWRVDDRSNSATAVLTIQVDSKPAQSQPVLKPGEVAGIVIGGFAMFAIIGIALAYMLYWFIAASRFQKQWESEFLKSNLHQNPLYQSLVTESFNPLYERQGTHENLS